LGEKGVYPSYTLQIITLLHDMQQCDSLQSKDLVVIMRLSKNKGRFR